MKLRTSPLSLIGFLALSPMPNRTYSTPPTEISMESMLEAKPIDRGAEWLNHLPDVFDDSGKLSLQSFRYTNDRLSFRLKYSEKDGRTHADFLYLNGVVGGNFTSQRPLGTFIDKDGKEDYFPPENFVSFCRSKGKKGLDCGYAVLRTVSQTPSTSISWKVFNGKAYDRNLSSILGGKVLGVIQELPERYGSKMGIVIENYHQKDDGFYVQKQVVAFDSREELRLIRSFEEKRMEGPENPSMYFDEAGNLVNGNLQFELDSANARNDREEFIKHYPSFKDIEGRIVYDSLSVSNDGGTIVARIEGVKCGDLDFLLGHLQANELKGGPSLGINCSSLYELKNMELKTSLNIGGQIGKSITLSNFDESDEKNPNDE